VDEGHWSQLFNKKEYRTGETLNIRVPENWREGVKFDDSKPRYDLIPPDALDALARLYLIGAQKYEDRNWEKGMRWGRVFAALMRHAWTWWRGREYDAETKCHHLISVAWCALTLYCYTSRKIGQDDRNKLA
jgi:hypothetical protein